MLLIKSGDGSVIYVANWFDNTLVRIDSESLALTGEVHTGNGPRAFGQFIASPATPSE